MPDRAFRLIPAAILILAILLPLSARAQTCPGIPLPCVEAESGQLNLTKRNHHPAKLKWKAKALDIAMDALDDPLTIASYAFCMYAGTAERLIKEADIDAGDNWKGGVANYRYRDKSASSGGIQKVKVQAGSLNDAKLAVKAKGDELLDIGFPFEESEFPILVQLTNVTTGACWETTFERTHFAKNGANRRGALRSTAVVKPERCREDAGCAVQRPLIGAALCRDRAVAGGGMAKRMKIKMGDITRCRQRESVGKTDGLCEPGLCPYSDPACDVLDNFLQSGVTRAIGHYQTKLDLACDDVSVAAVQESSGWGAPCEAVRTVDALMECLETQLWGEFGNQLGAAVFGDTGVLPDDLVRCRKAIAKQTQTYSSKFNTILYACRRSPIVRGRSCAEDPLVTGQVTFNNYVDKMRSKCTDAQISQLSFGAPCTGSQTVDELAQCLGQLARDLGFQGVALSYPDPAAVEQANGGIVVDQDVQVREARRTARTTR